MCGIKSFVTWEENDGKRLLKRVKILDLVLCFQVSEQVEQEELQRQQQVADLKVKQKTSSLLPESQANLQRLKVRYILRMIR